MLPTLRPRISTDIVAELDKERWDSGKRMTVKGKAKSKRRMWVNASLRERNELNDVEGLGDRKIEKSRQKKTEERG